MGFSSRRSRIPENLGEDGPGRPPMVGRVRVALLSRGMIATLVTLALGVACLVEWNGQESPSADSSLFGAHSGRVMSLALAPRDHKLASAGDDGSVYLWDTHRMTFRRVLERPAGAADVYSLGLAFSPDGSTLAAANSDGTIAIWDMASAKPARSLLAHATGVRTLAFSPDGRTLATGSWDRSIALWDVGTWRRRRELRGHRLPVMCLAFSRQGATLVSSGADGTIRLWDVTSGKNTRILRAHPAFNPPLRSLVFLPDGRTLVIPDPESAVGLWDAHTGRRLASLGQHEALVMAIAFAPDGRTLAWGTVSGRIEHRDIAGDVPRLLAAWQGHADPVTSLIFTPDSQRFISGGHDSALRIWDIGSRRTDRSPTTAGP
jgi:WD40 repeat protein